MILRRNNLRNEFPKSKQSLDVLTKKHPETKRKKFVNNESSVALPEVSPKKQTKKNKDLHHKVPSSNKKAKLSPKQKLNRKSQEGGKKYISKKEGKKLSKKSASCLEDLHSNLLNVDDSTNLRARLRSSTSLLRGKNSVQMEVEKESPQCANSKVSKPKLSNKISDPPDRIKIHKKTGPKKINCKVMKKENEASRNKSGKLPLRSKKLSSEMDDLFLSTSNIFDDSDDTSDNLSQIQRKSEKGMHSLKVKRSTRGSRKSASSDTQMFEDDQTLTSGKAGKKRKEPTKYYEEKTEKNTLSKKNGRRTKSESNTSTNKYHVITQTNKKQRRETLPKVLKATSSSLSRRVLSKSLSQKRLEGFNYHLNTVPVDDLTTNSFSTPTTVEKLFTTYLGKSPRVTSTPSLLRKSSKLSGVTITKKLLPGKGSLKRKRWVMSSLKGRNEGYEDDLFENCDFKEPLLLDDSDMSDISIATPKFAYMVSPNVSTKTPRFKDCYSPSELLRARKVAEEYMDRRNRMRRNCSMEDETAAKKKASSKKRNVGCIDPEKKRLEFMDLVDTLNKRQNLEINDDSEEEDDYFNDVSF